MATLEVKSHNNQSGTAMLREYFMMIRRRKWIVSGVILMTMALAWGYCLLAPKFYRSEALVLVDDQKMSEAFVQGVAEGNLEQRIFVIQKQVTSQALLHDVIMQFNLYSSLRERSGLSAAVEYMADSIVVEMVGKERRDNFVGRTGIDAFTIAFLHQDPELAMKVTDWIASKFIEANLRTREMTAEGTTEFLDDEVRRVKVELEKREDDLRRFKSLHMGELPQQMEANLRALDRLQSELNSVNESTQRLTDRQSLIQKALQEYQRYGRTNINFAMGPLEPDPLFRRLKELREKLIKLKAEFWDTYPEVLLTKDELEQVQKELIAVYGPDVLKPGEKPLDPYLQELKKQQSELGTELNLIRQRHKLLVAEQKDYERRVAKAPEVEQELLILERDYTNVKNSYTSLLEKRLNARVVENLEKRQKGGQFRMLGSATFPRTPAFPNQRRILVLGFLFGCVLGVGMIVMQEQLNPQFRHPEDVEYMVGPQLLAVIPNFMSEFRRMSKQGMLPSSALAATGNGHNPIGAVHAVGWRRAVGRVKTKGPWQEMEFVARWWPNSITGEQYRVAATRLSLLREEGQSTIAAVTSAVKGEGKTTTVVNLGYTLARDLGKRTLLMECDFGRPVLHRYLDTVPKWGLADVLLSDVPFEECLYGFGDVPCWIMPMGNCKTGVSDFLRTERFRHILTKCRQEFDYVLINTPPILPLATMNMIEQHMDMILLVVRASSTTHHVVRHAIGSLRANKPIHVILNAVESHSLPHYMYENYYEQAPRAETSLSPM